MKEVLRVDNIQKYYGKKENIVKAIDGISLQIIENQFVGVMGPSGCGKTTLLNVISSIDTVTRGEIYIKDKLITSIKRKNLAEFRREYLGFIFQDFKLLDSLTIGENIAIALTIKGTDETKIEELVYDIARKFNIQDILDKYPVQVSGGQKQRTACARAIVSQPSLILADEPTGALDSEAAKTLLTTLDNMNKKLNATILMVTHDPIASSYCDRFIFMKDGKIHDEIIKGDNNNEVFLQQILKIMADIR
ncbi:ABC transporter ATP-binding protein [Bacillus solimangrovi]|uniref:Multidrug ABC transporter ATP-binding protein n=1 Tax=Bacillus solimangrovi TaxID=1305675 RepID=A0A1E5LJT9_9BACI|nr:ABC transporter ATP-binding protein [Bacillus solimangrovi]OEH94363.1 multidrug ABC transporter ATP-binding protein [Bacillus solimangrovi]